jgi:carbon monoxide dehydrogenase subunit G
MVSRLLFTLSAGLLLAAPAEPRVDVTEAGGVYQASAAFAVPETPQSVMAVLSDFERIPKFMPDMEVSRVIERNATGMVVEQQAVSRFMMFAKRVHLVLDVRQDEDSLRFRDRCGRSFVVYDGAWVLSQHDSVTVVDYQLTAQPRFDVPAFVLKRLLKRDAGDLIDRIAQEIAARR